jgi:hypothetical protein
MVSRSRREAPANGASGPVKNVLNRGRMLPLRAAVRSFAK